MPVQFVCPTCRQLLSVGRRKIGSTVPCPRCGLSATVPDENTAAAEVAAARAARTQAGLGVMQELVVYDDIPELLAPSGAGAANGQGHAEPPGYLPAMPQRPAYAPARAGHMLLVSRAAVYLQGVLLCLVAGLGFALGYWAAKRPAPPPPAAADVAAVEDALPVSLKGTVQYGIAGGDQLIDEGAVVLAVPVGAKPTAKLSAIGLRPQDASGTGHQALQPLGGDYVRVQPTGAFELTVPRAGDYYLLIISNHAQRPPGEGLDRNHVGEMSPFFEVAGDLIGAQQYRWKRAHIDRSAAAISETFEVQRSP